MSLQIRLPLDGQSLCNLGLASTTISSSGVTYTTGGKTAVSCKNAGTITLNSSLETSVSEGFSYSIWWNIGENDTFTITMPGYNGKVQGNFRFGKMSYSGYCAAKWEFDKVDYFNGATEQPQLIWLYDKRYSSGKWSIDTWHNFIITIKNTSSTTAIVKSYIDGVEASSNSTSYVFNLIPGNITITGTAKTNDFRLYNHTLSPKEVKLISQGLIAHYPLSEAGLESTTNIVPYPTPGSAVSTSIGWDATLHPDAINVSNWSNGYNGGVTNPSIGYHAYWKLIDGLPTIIFNNLNSIIDMKGRWMGVNAGSLQSKLSASNTYTISFEAKGSVEGMTINSGIYYTKTSGTSAGFYDSLKPITVSTTWKRYSYTKTLNSEFNSSKNASLYFYGHYGNIEGTSYVRNIQLEIKDHATEYTRTSRAATTVEDCSGNNYNGAIVGSLTTSANSARYKNCCVFNGSSAIACGRSAMVTDALTVNWWGYMDNWSLYASSPMRALSCTEGGGWNFEPASSKMSFACGTGSSSNTYKNATGTTTFADMTAGWHMFTGTYDGYSTKIYIDGKLEKTNAAYTTKTPLYYNASNGIFIGAEAAGTTTTPASPYFTGKISDVRIYGTALSATDIADLYNINFSIDKNNSFFCRELDEGGNSNLSFSKNGIASSGSFDETMSLYDMPIKTLSDGSAWARIHWLDVSNNATYYTDANQVMKCLDQTNRYSRMGMVDQYQGKKFTITNLMPAVNTNNYSGGTSSSTYKKYGINSLQVTGTASSSEVYLTTKAGITYTPGHTYYARVEILQSTKLGSSDFYWKVAEPYIYAGKTISAVNTWTMISNTRTAATVIGRNGADWTAGSYTARLDFNNGKTAGDMWFTGMMLIDLTATFGSANEPTTAWCDKNIPYFTGTKTLEINDDSIGWYEFMLTYPRLSSTLHNRWKQTSSPNATTATDYTPITTAWSTHAGGIRKSSTTDSIYNCDNAGTTTWFAPIGQIKAWSDGIPGADGTAQKETELWIRVDTLPQWANLSLFNNKYMSTTYIQEI